MGCGSSSGTTTVTVDGPPYFGPTWDYKFINCEVTQTSPNALSMFTDKKMETGSDMAAYYPVISQPYQEGYTIRAFLPIPGDVKIQMLSTSAKLTYQAVLAKSSSSQTPCKQLVVDRCVLNMSNFQPGMFETLFKSYTVETASNSMDLVPKIISHTSQGERFIGMAMTGTSQGPTMGEAMKAGLTGGSLNMEVVIDLLFNRPSDTSYIYNAIVVPVKVTTKIGFAGGQNTVEVDWNRHLQEWVSTGWKFVTLYYDSGSSSRETLSTTITSTLNSVWIFEKDSSNNDSSPVYEAIIVEYFHEMKAGMGGMKVISSWDSTITALGKKGWELAEIVPTPEFTSKGTKVLYKMLLIFQRPLDT